MKPLPVIRSLLFFPGNNPRFIEKAGKTNADALALDLEDSVPFEQKAAGRSLAKEAIPKFAGKQVFVRVNSVASGLINDDLAEIVVLGLSGLVIPKSETPKEIEDVEKLLRNLEARRGLTIGSVLLIPLIETAEGVVNAHNIAIASPRVMALMFGAGDFARDMGVEWTKDGQAYSYARSKIPIDARAAGVSSIDSVYMDLADTDSFVKDTEYGKRIGYTGRAIIHPKYVEITNGIFLPSNEQVAWAKRVIEVFSEVSKKGQGAVSVDGTLVDVMHYRRAQDVLRLAESARKD
jgi:citrate lyase subunit beta / citryl-CoA lyase